MPLDIGGTVLNNIQSYNLANYSVPTSGLQVFLTTKLTESYPGSGTTWYDVSGNGKHFTWVTTPNTSSYSTGSHFVTAGNRCKGPASNNVGITNTSGYTIFLMQRQNTVASSTSAFKFYTTSGYNASTAGRGIFAHNTWGDGNVYFDQGGCCGGDTRTYTSAGGDTTDFWHVFGFRRLTSSSTRTIFKNGISIAENTAAAADINLGSTQIDLGSSDEYGGDSSNWNARISAFLVYNRGLTDAEMLQTSQSIRNLHGVPT
jgi:hypothetical protein